jgi:hypothetical protein
MLKIPATFPESWRQTARTRIYVGDDPGYKAEDKVKFTRVRIPCDFRFFPEETWPDGWERKYRDSILTVTVAMSSFKDDFDLTKNDLGKELCQPASMCSWDEGANVGKFDTAKSVDPRFAGRSTNELDEICAWSVQEIDCPKEGCIGFRFTMADKFVADDGNHRPPPQPFATDFLWNEI